MQKSIACHKCKHVWSYQPPLERRAECPKCGWDAHVCLNCRYFDRGAHHECREEQAEWVKEKEASNFCSYFEPSADADRSGVERRVAQSKLDELFGGGKRADDKPAEKTLASELERFLSSKK